MVQQMKTIIELQAIGDKSVNAHGSKVLSRIAVQMFSLQGQEEGASKYPSSPFMQRSSTRNNTHLIKDCLDATTFRSYFNKTRQQLQAQLTNLLKNNVPIVPVSLGVLLAPQLPELQFVQVVALPSQVADIHHLRVAKLSKTEYFAILTAWNRNKKCTALNLPVLRASIKLGFIEGLVYLLV